MGLVERIPSTPFPREVKAWRSPHVQVRFPKSTILQFFPSMRKFYFNLIDPLRISALCVALRPNWKTSHPPNIGFRSLSCICAARRSTITICISSEILGAPRSLVDARRSTTVTTTPQAFTIAQTCRVANHCTFIWFDQFLIWSSWWTVASSGMEWN